MTLVVPHTLIEGTMDAEVLKGTSSEDVIIAKDGDDIIKAAAGDDTVRAGQGDDSVDGGDGDDVIFGGSGDDEIRGGKGADVMDGQHGADTFMFYFGADFRTDTDDDIVINYELGVDSVMMVAPDAYEFDVTTVGDDLVIQVSTANGVDRGSITFDDLGGLVADGDISLTDLSDALNL